MEKGCQTGCRLGKIAIGKNDTTFGKNVRWVKMPVVKMPDSDKHASGKNVRRY